MTVIITATSTYFLMATLLADAYSRQCTLPLGVVDVATLVVVAGRLDLSGEDSGPVPPPIILVLLLPGATVITLSFLIIVFLRLV